MSWTTIATSPPRWSPTRQGIGSGEDVLTPAIPR